MPTKYTQYCKFGKFDKLLQNSSVCSCNTLYQLIESFAKYCNLIHVHVQLYERAMFAACLTILAFADCVVPENIHNYMYVPHLNNFL